MRYRLVFLAALCAPLSWSWACDGQVTGPSEVVLDSVRVVARATPAEVAPGDSLLVSATYYNRTIDPISLAFGAGCPFFLRVERRTSGAGVPFDGSRYACTAAGSTLTVPAGDSLASVVPIEASVDGVPVQRGSYAIHLDFTNGMWLLQTEVVVR